MKTEVKVGRGCGWIRVTLSPGKAGTLVYLNITTQVADVARDLLLSNEYTIWLQYGGGEPRPLNRSEKPLQLQEEFLSALGYSESSRRARLGIDPDLRHLIAFLAGPKWFCRSGEVWVLKGLVLPQWRRREVSLRQGQIIIHPGEGGGRQEGGKVCGCEEGAWPRGGRHVLKVHTPSRSVYLGMEELWQRGMWTSWLAEEENRTEGDLSGLGLTEVREELRHIRPSLDLSRNQLSGHLPEVAAARLSVAENRLSSLALSRGLLTLDVSGNRIAELPEDIGLLPE